MWTKTATGRSEKDDCADAAFYGGESDMEPGEAVTAGDLDNDRIDDLVVGALPASTEPVARLTTWPSPATGSWWHDEARAVVTVDTAGYHYSVPVFRTVAVLPGSPTGLALGVLRPLEGHPGGAVFRFGADLEGTVAAEEAAEAI